MSQGYYTLEKAAEVLGLNPAEVHTFREQNELRGYRDGPDWKFKVSDVEKKLAELIRERNSGSSDSADADDDLLLDESGTEESGSDLVIESPKQPASLPASGPRPESGSSINSGDIEIVDDLDNTVTDDEDASNLAVTQASDLDELDLTIDEDATLEDSQPALDDPVKPDAGSDSSLGSIEVLDDDSLVLDGDSGSGSDITIGGDSGISLVDPADSGLSLEDPVALIDSGGESLELGEDDMLVLGEDADEAPTELDNGDSDFLLTPLGDGDEDEDSESGSQVIALDSIDEADEAQTMVAGAGTSEMAAMLDEDFTPGMAPDTGTAAVPLAAVTPTSAAMPQTPINGAAAVTLPEAPYSMLNIIALVFCALFLMLTGMMLYDLVRNIWSWNGEYSVNSSLMDMVLGWLP